MKRIIGSVLVVLWAGHAGIAGPVGAAPRAPAGLQAPIVELDVLDPEVIDLDAVVDVNALGMIVTNQGTLAYDLAVGDSGLEWPRNSGKHVVLAAGLWLGARVGGELRLAIAEYAPEYAAGPLDASGVPIDPEEIDPAHRVYKINAGDSAENPDYAAWPAALGAPVDNSGNPRVIGDQTLWCIYNDAVAGKHILRHGGTAPLGVEVRQTVFAFDQTGALGQTIFLDFEIENKGGNVLEDTYLSFWFDPDLGGASDDLVGCDTTLSLGYCYNSTNDDAIYGAHPPALGCLLLQGPIVGGDTLGMTSFNKYIGGADPDTSIASYRLMQGIDTAGNAQTCEGATTPFILSGDPVTGTGCVDSLPADRRFMVNTGPFTMEPGAVQRIVAAVIVGGVDGEGDRLTNLTQLRSHAAAVRDAYERGFDNLNRFPDCDGGGPYTGNVDEPVAFDGRGSGDPDGSVVTYAWTFGDGETGSGPQPSHAYLASGLFRVTLTTVDDAGGTSFCLTEATVYETGGVSDFTDATVTGIQDAGYLNQDTTNRRALVGVDWGGRFYQGSFDTGCRWSGSSIVGDAAELAAALCPGAELALERFGTVELRFDGSQRGYRYLRRDVPLTAGAAGAAPANGRGYIYIDHAEIPFTAWKRIGGSESQLQVMFTERQGTDEAGNPLATQPASQDGTWRPTSEADGGHEYLAILDVPYTGTTPDPAYTEDGIFFAGTAPVLFGGWLRRRSDTDVIDPGDRIVIDWLDLADHAGSAGDALIAWADLDADGDHDLHVTGGATPARLFEADGVGGYSEFGEILIHADGIASAISWIDVDNDEDLDLFLSFADSTHSLWRNDGRNTGHDLFSDATELAAIPPSLATAAAWADVDGDGDLDLFLANDGPDGLYLNDGDGGFVDATPAFLSTGDDRTTAGRWADFDQDGNPDLALTGETGLRLGLNEGNGLFADGSHLLPGGDGGLESAADAAWGDFDQDLDLDLYVANPSGANRLLRNDGGVFADAGIGAIEDPAGSRRVTWQDLDNDGDLDLFVVNRDAAHSLFENAGEATFVEVMIDAIEAAGDCRDAAWADDDGDGDLDLYLGRVDAPNLLLRNRIDHTRWLQIDLVGQTSNVMGIGARVLIKAGGVTQLRTVATSGDAPTIALGISRAERIERVEVRWPSGSIKTLTDLDINQRLEIGEGSLSPLPEPLSLSLGQSFPNPFHQAAAIRFVLSTTSAVRLRVYDVTGRLVRRLVDDARAPGEYEARWDGRNEDGEAMATGTYFYRLETEGASRQRKLLLLR